MRAPFALVLLPGLLLTACGGAPAPVAIGAALQHNEPATVAKDADLSTPPEASVTFDPGWSQQVIGTIYGGGSLHVAANAARFPKCGIAGTVTAFVQADSAKAVELTLTASAGNAGWVDGRTPVPASATQFTLWLRAQQGSSCTEYDSALGTNYAFAVHAWKPTVVHFGSDWSKRAEGPIAAGGVLVVDYDITRLPDCRAYGHYGLAAWDVVTHARFDDGTEMKVSVAAPVGASGVVTDRVQGLSLLPVPRTATHVDLWFENTQAVDPPYQPTVCQAWDSNYGANYGFSIVPPADQQLAVGWAGQFNYVQFHRPPARNLGDVDPIYWFDSMSGGELAAWLEVQVWVPGLTDKHYGSTGDVQAAATRLLAQAVTDARPGSVDGWSTIDLINPQQSGNNFVYRFDIESLRSQYTTTPVVAPGLYHYYVRFSADGGQTWLTAGRDADRTRRLVVAATQDCTLFPDHAPEGCPQPRAVGWAGNWGGRFTHQCDWVDGVVDPVVFTKSAGGEDCMVVGAEVYVAGLTDAGDAASGLLAQIETDLTMSGGPATTPVTYDLKFEGRVGNNWRYSWDAGQYVARADRGDYRYRLRFSADNGVTWYTIGSTDAPAGAFRSLWVRNDSNDVTPTQSCTGVESWQGSTNVFPSCLSYAVAENFDAANCEFFVNALGRGSFSHDGASASWLEAYLSVGAQDGELLGVGMLTHLVDATGATQPRWDLGQEISPAYWRTGTTYARQTMGPGSYAGTVTDFAFFIDVRRPSGTVARLWISNGGANYTIDGVFAVGGTSAGSGITDLEYANDGSIVFGQKHACGH